MNDAKATSPALPPPPVQKIDAGNGFAVAALMFGIASLFIVFENKLQPRADEYQRTDFRLRSISPERGTD